MLPLDHPDRIQITFDDHRLVANAGLLLPVTLAQHLGLRELVDSHVDLGAAPGRANPDDKMLTLVASALAGGDCIDDADVLRTGGTAGALGCVVKAPSTPPLSRGQALGTFLRSFRWGHVRQLDRVSRPAIEKKRRRRVLVVTTGSPRPMRAVQRARCPASTIFAGWRQSVLPVHLLGLAPLLGSVGPVAGDVKLQDDGVVHDPVNRRGGGHGVGEDALPLREDQV